MLHIKKCWIRGLTRLWTIEWSQQKSRINPALQGKMVLLYIAVKMNFHIPKYFVIKNGNIFLKLKLDESQIKNTSKIARYNCIESTSTMTALIVLVMMNLTIFTRAPVDTCCNCTILSLHFHWIVIAYSSC